MRVTALSENPGVMTLQATVYGHVQGVGFRFFVHDAANRLGLRGYTRNQEDGSVFVLASGGTRALHELLNLLRKGPSSAYVASVQDYWAEGVPHGFGSHFEVRP